MALGFHGKKTASGEIYDQTKLTAAHKTLPLGTKARVTNLDNGSAVEVEINDRGPFVDGRIIDLSRAAAGALGLVESGTAPVRVELIAERGLQSRTTIASAVLRRFVLLVTSGTAVKKFVSAKTFVLRRKEKLPC